MLMLNEMVIRKGELFNSASDYMRVLHSFKGPGEIILIGLTEKEEMILKSYVELMDLESANEYILLFAHRESKMELRASRCS